MLFKKLTVSFVLSLSILLSTSSVFAIPVVPGGESIGIQLNYEGVLITGGYEITVDGKKYNPLENGFAKGDIIVAANEKEVTSIATLTEILSTNVESNSPISLTLKRNNEQVKQDITVSYDEKTKQFTTGLYVKDSLMGVGTMTYYNPKTKSFGSLGHAMNDVELNDQALLKAGTIYKSNVTGIKKGSPSHAGQKIADISDIAIGKVDNHSQFGIYGKYNDNALDGRSTIETASMSEVKLGKAYFLTVLDNNDIVECEINITNLDKQNKASEKGITFEITDTNVIEKTNGIIQGMSGSPIIQDGKIIGCVTHVSSNSPSVGYGLYIDWMLEMDNQGENGQ